MTNRISEYEAELKAKIRLYPLLGVAAGIVIGFLLRSLF